MDTMDGVVILIVVVVIGIFGFLLGASMENENVLEAYCESKNSVYEIIQRQPNCIKDNKIEPIEWYLEKE